LSKTFFVTGLDILPVLSGNRMVPWFLEVNHLPGLVDPIPEANEALQRVNRRWLRDLLDTIEPLPRPRPTRIARRTPSAPLLIPRERI
jgi:hypothetical protein